MFFSSLNEIDVFSCTDMEQAWGKAKRNVVYTGEILSTLDCLRKPKKIKDDSPLDHNTIEMISNILIRGFPHSAYALHKKGRQEIMEEEWLDCEEEEIVGDVGSLNNEQREWEEEWLNEEFEELEELEELNEYELDERFSTLMNNFEDNFQPQPSEVVPDNFFHKQVVIKEILNNNIKNTNTNKNIEEKQQRFYNKNILINSDKAVEMCLNTCDQSSNVEWFEFRKNRITASRCYELYTYKMNENRNKKLNWELKIKKFLNPSNLNHVKSIAYGRLEEKNALKAYELETSNTVTNIGFLVHPNASYLGCSPDGLIPNKKLLLEIKCPISGKDLEYAEFLSQLKYLKLDKFGNYELKKLQYYAQIQLSLFILNYDSCDFVVYCKKDDKCFILNIKYDVTFTRNLTEKLEAVYFDNILPQLCN